MSCHLAWKVSTLPSIESVASTRCHPALAQKEAACEEPRGWRGSKLSSLRLRLVVIVLVVRHVLMEDGEAHVALICAGNGIHALARAHTGLN